MPSLKNVFLAFRELGWRQSALFALYRLGLASGYFRRNPRPPQRSAARIRDLPTGWLPSRDALPEPGPKLPEEVAEILAGRVRIFGALNAPLDFTHPVPLSHWTDFKRGTVTGKDIKLFWEPARFGWAVRLARGHHLGMDAGGTAFFYRQVADFMAANPPYQGLQWANGQEAALRLIHIAFAHLVFGGSDMAHILAVHARRLPATLLYARAQNNNHLISEAAGLLTAGVLLEGHPEAAGWTQAGWRWLNAGLQAQIAADGTYVQQSANYHRLMLTLALWGRLVGGLGGLSYPPETLVKLDAASRWLAAHCDQRTGAVPNLGPNDGAWILPLSDGSYSDFRPVVQASLAAFSGLRAFSPGPWDELARWLQVDLPPEGSAGPDLTGRPTPIRLEQPEWETHLFLRAVRFTARPGHADQLHVDLWRRGENIAMDAGTYLYNADAPWDNALQRARHHNTLTIAGRDQMTRAGRFLYVNRAQAKVLGRGENFAEAEHDGYRSIGAVHRRRVEAVENGWRVIDRVLPAKGQPPREMDIRLHWLLPDAKWQASARKVIVQAESGTFELSFAVEAPSARLAILRAGDCVYGEHPRDPTMGWFSPTYAVKEPALSVIFEVTAALPVKIFSEWCFLEKTK